MRNLAVLLTLVFSTGMALGQLEGTVTYQETYRIESSRMERMMNHPQLTDEMKDMIKKMIEDHRQSDWQLEFNDSLSLYQAVKEEEEEPQGPPAEGWMGHMQFMAKKMKDEARYQTNLKNKEVLNNESIMDKNFLVSASMDSLKWKLTGQIDTVLGYFCQHAMTYDDTIVVQAWFTPQIPIPSGPRGLGNLPGLILKVDRGAGQIIMEATEVKLEPLPEDVDMSMPSKGKKTLTREEFVELRREKFEEMRQQGGGGMMIGH